jgi:DNA polymerase I
MIYFISPQSSMDGEIEKCSFQEALSSLSRLPILGFDTETTGKFDHANRILLLQLGNKENQYVFDFQSLDQRQRDMLETEIFDNPDKLKLAHNAVFDIRFLWRHGIKCRRFYDTLIAEKLLNAGISQEKGFYSLYSVALKYTGVQLNKEVRGEIHKTSTFTPRVIAYAAEDVAYLEDIRKLQMAKLMNYNMAKEDCQDELTVCGLEMRNLLVFASYSYNGALIDLRKLKEADNEVLQELNEVDKAITEYVHRDDRLKKFRVSYQDLFTALEPRISLNLNSPSQKLSALRSIFPDILDTSERTLSRLKNKPDGGEFIKLLLEHNRLNKIRTAFTDKLPSYINPNTGRIHPEYNQVLDTGRVSSSNPNIQQIPSRSKIGSAIRKCFIPSKGHKMVGGDFSGAELRIIAEFSKDPVWVEAFLNGEDLHSKLCSMTFRIPISQVKEPADFKPTASWRDVQKTLNFG